MVDEEQSGPILPVIKYSDPEDALHRINKSDEGLGGSIWSGGIEAAQELACRMESGNVWINKHAELGPGIPFSGARMPGAGNKAGFWSKLDKLRLIVYALSTELERGVKRDYARALFVQKNGLGISGGGYVGLLLPL